MAKIDPSARIASGAEIAEDAVVGPWCQVGPNVRIGAGAVLDSMVLVEGRTEIGPGCRLHHGAVVGTAPQDLKYRGGEARVSIGAGTVIREYATVNRATDEHESTVVGKNNLIMAYAHVAHNCRLGDQVILANSVNLAGHIEVGDWAIIGGVTVVHQFAKIGEHVMIGGGSRVPMDLAPYLKAAGSPLRVTGINSIGLERRGFSPEAISNLKRLYRLFFRSSLLLKDAVAKIREELPGSPEVELFLSFVERSERGLHRPSRHGAA
ncbi:MAG: acyl-ACP--UDP-N-acetylglucosamine O-acyltransferase [Candidatus Eisenbacteria bacterium]|nr:acyl-ACP--UDP-N-acetylglucosamine O-acyltransferase [Candidatus Eisenbacteria bacterium]